MIRNSDKVPLLPKAAVPTATSIVPAKSHSEYENKSPAVIAPKYRVPADITLSHAIRLSIVEDKPILMDYWTASLDKSVIIGIKLNKEQLLVKDSEQYTSPISQIFKSGSDYIIKTENSIYIVDVEIASKRIS
jgi:hypothetical protein